MTEYCKHCGAPYEFDADVPRCECWLWKAIEEHARTAEYDPEGMPAECDPGFHDDSDLGLNYEDTSYELPPNWNEYPYPISDHQNNELRSSQHFNQLKFKYWVANHLDQELNSPLYQILLSLEDGLIIGENHLKWLKKENLFALAGFAHYHNYQKNGDGWEITKACSSYKIAGSFQEGIRITENITGFDDRLMCAIHTTRGASFRALRDIPSAFDNARKALEFNPKSYRVFSLLGGIYFDAGNFEKGLECFEISQKLAPINTTNNSLEISFRELDAALRQQSAVFLLNKNPMLYGWAQKYLPQQPTQILSF